MRGGHVLAPSLNVALSPAERQRRYRERHRERLNAEKRQFYAANREAERARYDAWAARNREHLAARSREWVRSEAGKVSQAKYYARNREARLAANKRWREANRERRREVWKTYRANRQARKRSAPGYCDRAQFDARWQVFGGKCWMCGADADSIDHVIPLARGGTNWPSNLRPACRSCNSAKGARSWQLYAPRKEAA